MNNMKIMNLKNVEQLKKILEQGYSGSILLEEDGGWTYTHNVLETGVNSDDVYVLFLSELMGNRIATSEKIIYWLDAMVDHFRVNVSKDCWWPVRSYDEYLDSEKLKLIDCLERPSFLRYYQFESNVLGFHSLEWNSAFKMYRLFENSTTFTFFTSESAVLYYMLDKANGINERAEFLAYSKEIRNFHKYILSGNGFISNELFTTRRELLSFANPNKELNISDLITHYGEDFSTSISTNFVLKIENDDLQRLSYFKGTILIKNLLPYFQKKKEEIETVSLHEIEKKVFLYSQLYQKLYENEKLDFIQYEEFMNEEVNTFIHIDFRLHAYQKIREAVKKQYEFDLPMSHYELRQVMDYFSNNDDQVHVTDLLNYIGIEEVNGVNYQKVTVNKDYFEDDDWYDFMGYLWIEQLPGFLFNPSDA